MRDLKMKEIQNVSGAGVVFAVAALPLAVVGCFGGATMATASGILGAFLAKKNPLECIWTGISSAPLGLQVGVLMEQAAYNW